VRASTTRRSSKIRSIPQTAPDRLARLQRLHGRHQGNQGVHRRQRPPQGKGNMDYRTGRRRHGAWRNTSTRCAVLRRRRLSLAGGGVQRRGVRVTVISTISSQPPMIAGRVAAAGRCLHRLGGVAVQARSGIRPHARRHGSRATMRRSSYSARPRWHPGAMTTTLTIKAIWLRLAPSNRKPNRTGIARFGQGSWSSARRRAGSTVLVQFAGAVVRRPQRRLLIRRARPRPSGRQPTDGRSPATMPAICPLCDADRVRLCGRQLSGAAR